MTKAASAKRSKSASVIEIVIGSVETWLYTYVLSGNDVGIFSSVLEHADKVSNETKTVMNSKIFFIRLKRVHVKT